jgi:hypothetical protein
VFVRVCVYVCWSLHVLSVLCSFGPHAISVLCHNFKCINHCERRSKHERESVCLCVFARVRMRVCVYLCVCVYVCACVCVCTKNARRKPSCVGSLGCHHDTEKRFGGTD